MNPLKKMSIVFCLIITTFGQVSAQKQGTTKTSVEQVQWKTYANEKYAFQFRYPSHWVQDGTLTEVINLKGEIIGINLTFHNNKTESNFTVDYYLPPNGKKLYDYTAEEAKSFVNSETQSIQKIVVANKDAFKSTFITTINGKGNELSKPLLKIITEFLDKENQGEFKLEINMPKEQVKEAEYFNKSVSSFKFK